MREPSSVPPSYYADKLAALADIFGAEVELDTMSLRVCGIKYPIVDDVIILLSRDRCPPAVRLALARRESTTGTTLLPSEPRFSHEVQAGFGLEWQVYRDILPEHAQEFRSYFDLVDLATLKDLRVCDLGCGNGRWSHFVAPHCRELVLVDFSEAIFVARRNLDGMKHALFFMGDVTALPFRRDCFDFAFCLGVLHHLPVLALDAVVQMAPLARTLLIYVYYALDNRPAHVRAMLTAVTAARKALSGVGNPRARRLIARLITAVVYVPLITLGHLAEVFGKGRAVPLFEWYRGMSLQRIEQDAYDRFFTSIEQRVSRLEITRELAPTFASVTISERQPYWHFLCRRC